MPQPIIIDIQHCINCHLHSWCSRHDPQKYLAHFQILCEILQEYLKRERLPFKIKQNVIPQSYEHIEGSKYYDELEDKVVIFPRLGAFEVRVMGVTVFSKMLQGCWPKEEKVLFAVQEIVKELRKREKQRQRQKNTKERDTQQDQEEAIFRYYLKRRFDIQWKVIQQEQDTTAKMFRIREIARKRNMQFSQFIEYKTGISLQKEMLQTADFYDLKRSKKLPQVRLKNRSHDKKLLGFSPTNSIVVDRKKRKSILDARMGYNPQIQVIYPIRKRSVIFPSPKIKNQLSELRRKLKVYNEDDPPTNSKEIETYLQPVFPQYFKRSDPRYLLEREEIKERMIIVEKLEEGLAMNERKKRQEQEDTNQGYSPDKYENRGNYARKIIQSQQVEKRPKRRQLVIPKQEYREKQVEKEFTNKIFPNDHQEKRDKSAQIQIKKQLITQIEGSKFKEIIVQNNQKEFKKIQEVLYIKQQGKEENDAKKKAEHRKEEQDTVQKCKAQERIQDPRDIINNHDSEDSKNYHAIPNQKGQKSMQSLDSQSNTSELKYSNSANVNIHTQEELIKVLEKQESNLSVRLQESEQAFLKQTQLEKGRKEQSFQRKQVVSNSDQHQQLSVPMNFQGNFENTFQKIIQEKQEAQKFQPKSQQEIQMEQRQILREEEQSNAGQKIQDRLQKKASLSQADQTLPITHTLVQNGNYSQSSIVSQLKLQIDVCSLQKIHWKAKFRFTEQQNMLDGDNDQNRKGQYLLMKQNETQPWDKEQEQEDIIPHIVGVLTDEEIDNGSQKMQSKQQKINLKSQEQQDEELNLQQKVIQRAVYNNKSYNLERQERLDIKVETKCLQAHN